MPWIFCTGPTHALFADLRFARAYIGEQVFGLDGLEHGDDCRRCNRAAAEGRAEVAGTEARRELVAAQHRAAGNTAAERLGTRDHVRLDAVRLQCEEMAAAADAGLHFVGDQERAMARALRTQGR